MSISEQVKELRNLSFALWFDTPTSAMAKTALSKAAYTIESLSAKLQAANMERSEDCGGWIPISKRLPESETWVLTTHKSGLNSGKQIIVHYFKDGEFLYNWDMDNDFNSPTFGQRYMGDIIAWMPYPDIFNEDDI